MDLAAQKLAHKIGADILVYGTIDTTQSEWQVQPRFVISPDYYFKDLIDVIGQHQLGSPFGIPENVEAIRRQQLRQVNSQRSRLLASIVIGETFTVLSDYDKALQVFHSIENDLSSWDDPAADKLVNLLMGNAAGRYYVQSKTPELLDESEKYYRQALAADANYARAILGLGSVAYTRALLNISQSTDPTDLNNFTLLDIAQLDQSRQFDLKAAQLAETPDLAHIQEKVAYGLGKIYFAQILYEAMTSMEDQSFQPAIDEFQKVIAAFAANKDEVFRELAAESHASLGQIYSLTGEIELAEDHYRQAIQLNRDPQREKLLDEELANLEG